MPPPKTNSSAQTIDQIRVKARRRLIGAIIIVVLAVAILPWLFDSEQRPSVVDIPIEIEGQTPTVVASERSPVTVPEDPAQTMGEISPVDAGTILPQQVDNVVDANTVEQPPMTDAAAALANATTGQHNEGQGGTDLAQSDGYAVRPAGRSYLPSKFPASMTSSAAASTPGQAPSDDALRAATLLGDPSIATANDTRAPAASAPRTQTATGDTRSYMVQIGAYADENKANEVRARLTMAGYTTVIQTVQTEAGKLIRVRAGPYSGRAAADAVATKIRAMNLQATVVPG